MLAFFRSFGLILEPFGVLFDNQSEYPFNSFTCLRGAFCEEKVPFPCERLRFLIRHLDHFRRRVDLVPHESNDHSIGFRFVLQLVDPHLQTVKAICISHVVHQYSCLRVSVIPNHIR